MLYVNYISIKLGKNEGLISSSLRFLPDQTLWFFEVFYFSSENHFILKASLLPGPLSHPIHRHCKATSAVSWTQTPNLSPEKTEWVPFLSHNSGKDLHSQFSVTEAILSILSHNIQLYVKVGWQLQVGNKTGISLEIIFAIYTRFSMLLFFKFFLNYTRNSFSCIKFGKLWWV